MDRARKFSLDRTKPRHSSTRDLLRKPTQLPPSTLRRHLHHHQHNHHHHYFFKMSTPTVAEPEAVNFETSFHLDKDITDAENYMVVHALMGRGQLLNAYEVRQLLPNDVFHRVVPNIGLKHVRARARIESSGDPIRRFFFFQADVSIPSPHPFTSGQNGRRGTSTPLNHTESPPQEPHRALE